MEQGKGPHSTSDKFGFRTSGFFRISALGFQIWPVTALLGMCALMLAVPSLAAIRPNIIFILADDLGWRDLGCYGSTFYETPHLDKLAASGMRFTDAYAACNVCSPTRARILA